MSKKIKLYDNGDCVLVTHWGNYDKDGFLHNVESIGLVLEAELVEMGDNEDMNIHDAKEWMYRVVLPNGRITEVWDYEIKPVNVMGKNYNNLSHKPKGA